MQLTWLERSDHWMLVVTPAAKMMTLRILQQGTYRCDALGVEKNFAAESVEDAKLVAQKWLISLMSVIQEQLEKPVV